MKKKSKLMLRLRTLPIGSIIILIAVLFGALFAPLLAPVEPGKIDLLNSLTPPVWAEGGSSQYLLGTDDLGRDILSRMLYGARISLLVSIAAIALSGSFGTLLGLLAGYFGGWQDAVIMRVTDTFLSIPFMLMALAIVGVLGPSLTNIIVVLAITNWAKFARMVRGETLSVREQDYVRLAEVAGCSHTRTLLRHILPNVANSLIILATLDLGRVIILESAMSFLGLGVQPPNISWGLMVAEGRKYLVAAWWYVTFPGVAIALTVLGGNLLGDYLRDIFDPGYRKA
ncbi:MAG: peptide ABC transporter permease [Rhodospirillaceae bacterium]|nr:peptide ABC transporter permease [Rhodospirillaceae bacterium]MDP6674791.1 ABC transporter permease [Gammaproteobacteria bacterium]|tara:strand:- start:89 stop:943 length:855 start_codon:yes stop_codon:yes gene_type:complete